MKNTAIKVQEVEGPLLDSDDDGQSEIVPSLHTRYPRHKSKPVQNPKKEYENVWDTSLFYPANIGAKVGLPPTKDI